MTIHRNASSRGSSAVLDSEDRDLDPKTARTELQVQGDRCVKNDIEDVKVAFDMREGDG